jgi:zinc transporter 9
MEPQTLIFVFAAIMFFAVAVFGYVPLTLELSSDRLKQLTAIGAGVLIGSAFLVIIPEALEIFEGHEEEEEGHEEAHIS